MNPLDTNVSFYDHFGDTGSTKTGTFLQIVSSVKLAKKCAALLEKIRQTDDKKARTELKKLLPCFTPSGVFSSRLDSGLVTHSGLLVFDIDPKENPWLNEGNAPELRDRIAGLPEVAYIALSASGKGVWGVVVISQPEHHAAHFAALEKDFVGWGISTDAACKNVSRLRYWSHDPGHKINPNPVIYSKLIFPKADTYTPRYYQTNSTDNGAKVEAILGQLSRDITGNYPQWFSIGCALSSEFGESGRDYFHQVSQHYPKYSRLETDKQYTACLRGSRQGFTIATFFDIAKRHGLEFKTATAQRNGVRDERGYPAAWDEPTPPQPSRLEAAAALFSSDWKAGAVQPITPEYEAESAARRERARRWYPGAFGITRNAAPEHIERARQRQRRA